MTDVAVYGATGAGVAAAVAAHETGARTVLVEPGTHVGGMVSGGPGWTDADSVPLADAASQGRRESARARLPLRVPRRIRLGADGADADAARPRRRSRRGAGRAQRRRGAGRRGRGAATGTREQGQVLAL